MNKVNNGTNFGASNLLVTIKTMLLALVILVGIIWYLEITKPEQCYFAKNTANKFIKMTSLDEPNVSSRTLLRWASLAVTTAYTLDFVEYQTTLDSLKPYFTKTGYVSFLAAANSRLQDIIKQKLIVTAVIADTPVLLGEGIISGFYAWKIQIPILLSYQGASEKSTKQSLVVNLLVMRVPIKEASTGIGIAQIQDTVIYNN